MKLLTSKPTSLRSFHPKKYPTKTSPLLYLTLIFSLLFLLYFFSLSLSSLLKTQLPNSPNCPSLNGDRFLWYAPHSGFNNQLMEFKNGILLAGILNRTLVVPPVLNHHAVALGSCPKFRVTGPNEIRGEVWDHVVELIRSGRYVSMADIVDISSLVSSPLVRVIDFRVFMSLWCNVKLDFACHTEFDAQPYLLDKLKECGSVLTGVKGNAKCVHAVSEDCRTTVWTYQNGKEDGALDSFQPDEKLKKKKIPYVRKRRDVYKTFGPGSKAESASVLAFGSLFTAPYKGSELLIDIHESPRDLRIGTLMEEIEFLPFTPAILSAGKKFALDTIKAPFLCAQLRLLDGQFKNHWKTTFEGLKQKVETLMQSNLPIHIFVMTDLPESNWTGNYLGDLARDSNQFKLFILKESDELVIETAKRIVDTGHGMKFNNFANVNDGTDQIKKSCPSAVMPDVLLYIEQTVCSCASLGFVGTAGSTIAGSIELMRKFRACFD
ncbi:O-fucosyltransferase 30 [Argentina anserina]|uniref:O-fucosyltransferase 30 n=1 Tax=Argentina anserina TaxID=57926 RepID=UPI0021765191|nr:O-fucosyltransferase 30 [Potentilla anserina]